MKENIIYIQINKQGGFEVTAICKGISLGIYTDNIKSTIACIEAVNRSINILNIYGKIAYEFVNGVESYNRFADKVGRENLRQIEKYYKKYPIQVKK